MHTSEVARLRTQMTLEYEASRQALSGLAIGTTRHEFITNKLERMGEYHQRLTELVGEAQATEILYDVWEGQKE
jgi:hypothetical protein